MVLPSYLQWRGPPPIADQDLRLGSMVAVKNTVVLIQGQGANMSNFFVNTVSSPPQRCCHTSPDASAIADVAAATSHAATGTGQMRKRSHVGRRMTYFMGVLLHPSTDTITSTNAQYQHPYNHHCWRITADLLPQPRRDA